MTAVLTWQMDIYHRIRGNLPNTRVFLEGVPENSVVPSDPTGLIKPFVIVWFGQLTTSTDPTVTGPAGLCDEGSGDIVGKQGNMAVEVVAPSGLSLIQLEDAIRQLLQGYAPAGQGALTEDGSTAIRDMLPVGIGDQLRFYKAVFYRGDFLQSETPLTALAMDARTHCPQGHPYDEVNTIINSDGKRRCRTCINARARARRTPSPG